MKRRDFLVQASLTTVGGLMNQASSARVLANAQYSPTPAEKCRSLEIRSIGPKTAAIARVAEILENRIRERCGISSRSDGWADCVVELGVDEKLEREEFLVAETSGGTLRILGNDSRALLYGVGKFLRTNTYHEGFFELGAWRGTSRPAKTVRGICMITHFFNFYHVAPIELLRVYIEDLALWGFNLIVFGFDIHKFEGIGDPAAQAMLERISAIGRTAKNLGLAIGLGIAVNDAYSNSPVAMRADWTAGHDGYVHELAAHYHLELCPNKPGAKQLLMKWRGETFAALKDLGLDYVIPWPYDNGGCTSSTCKPWGTNGYLSLAQPIAEMARRDFPGCKIILSTWLFDYFTSGEYSGLEKQFDDEKPNWVDYILVDEFTGIPRYSGQAAHQSPGGFPLVSFPEISMWEAYPWGGFGANPAPLHHQEVWARGKDSLAGGFLYSEGIFEDLNKVLYSQFYWSKDRKADSIVNEYIAYEFSPTVSGPVGRAIEILEKNLPRQAENLDKGIPRFVLKHHDNAEEAFDLIQSADKQLPSRVRASWRWRILYLRAHIDNELVKNDFRISSRSEEALRELTRIFYADRAILAVSPVTREAIERHRSVAGRDL